MLPKSTGIEIDLSELIMPDCYRWIMKAGKIAPEEMLRTFNCGVGMVCAVSPEQLDEAVQVLKKSGEADVVMLGKVTGSPGVKYVGQDRWAQQASL